MCNSNFRQAWLNSSRNLHSTCIPNPELNQFSFLKNKGENITHSKIGGFEYMFYVFFIKKDWVQSVTSMKYCWIGCLLAGNTNRKHERSIYYTKHTNHYVFIRIYLEKTKIVRLDRLCTYHFVFQGTICSSIDISQPKANTDMQKYFFLFFFKSVFFIYSQLISKTWGMKPLKEACGQRK